MTDTEINEAVARKLGWTGIYETAFEFEQMGTVDPIKKVTKIGEFRRKVKPIPAYSTDIAAAWEIVELIPKFQMAKDYRGIWCVGSGWQDEWTVLGEADTAPRAICLAFLKLENAQ